MFEQNTPAEKENKELSKLVNINKDASEFYNKAANDVENDNLRTTLIGLKNLHEDVVTNIQKRIQENGGEADAKETLTGQTAQLWAKLAEAVTNDVDKTLVSQLEEAEDRCLHSIQDIIDDEDVTPATKNFLQSEKQALQKSHDYMKSLKDSMKAA